MGWAEYGIGMRERNSFNIFFDNYERKEPVGVCRRSLEENRNANVKYVGLN